jgi:hypothetical protein
MGTERPAGKRPRAIPALARGLAFVATIFPPPTGCSGPLNNCLRRTWGNFPSERQRLFRLIRDTRANGVVLLSGDRHLAEMSRLPVDHPDGVGYPLFDVTSSSLNAPSGNFTRSKVRFANEVTSNKKRGEAR